MYIGVLVNYYSNLTSAVKWNTCMSRWLLVGSGVRQGGVLSHVYLLFLAICLLVNLEIQSWMLFYMFMGCIMYADDIILLSGSLNDLQSTSSVCGNVSSQLMLKFNTNKCKCSLLLLVR